MIKKVFFSSSFILRGIFIIALFVFIFISSVTYRHTIALTESTELIEHSYQIQLQLEQLLSYLKDAETGQRGYIISGDSVFLEPYNSAIFNLNRSFRILKSITADHSQEKEILDSVYYLVSWRMAMLAKSLDMVVESPIRKDALRLNLFNGKKVMDKVCLQMNRMTDLELMRFKSQERKYKHELNFTPHITLYLMLFSFTFLFIS